MMRKPVFYIVLLLIFPVFSLSASGVAEASGTGMPSNSAYFDEALGQYRQGSLGDSAELFKRAAVSPDPGKSSAAYYNHGRVQAEIAGQTSDQEVKRSLLESSYESFRRSVEIGGLPEQQRVHARQNMEIVREQLSRLPENGNGQDQQGEKGQQSGSENQERGQSGVGGEDQSPQEMLQQQQELRRNTESGEGQDSELADRQKQLQKASENAGRNEAAQNQSKAAEALEQGDREKAAEHQKRAEQALAEAAEQDAAEGQEQEADKIMNQEAERRAENNRLDKSGGIREADRNW